MHVDEAIAQALAGAGVTAVFALMSDEVSHLIVELGRRGVTVHTTRHEAGAVGMADGYARVSGGVGVAIVGRGPGLTNALTATVCAAKSGSPVLVLAGDSASGVGGPDAARAAANQPKHIAQADLLAAAGVSSLTITSPGSAAADIVAILEHARSGVTVAVNLPTDVMTAEAGSEPATVSLPDAALAAAVDPATIEAMADVLDSFAGRRPVIVAGRGALRSGALPDLVRLGDRIGALLGTTLLARSSFSGHPFDIGIVGSFMNPVAAELVGEAGLILAFGASLGPYTTYGGDLFRRALVIQVDTDPAAFGRTHRADLPVTGDAAAVTRALDAALDVRGVAGTGLRAPDVAERLAAFDPRSTFADRSEPGRLDPRTAMIAIDAALPRDRIVVIDPGHHLTWSGTYLTAPGPTSFIFPGASGAIGSAPAIAYGAAVAAPDRRTVLDVGDGGMMMSLADLATVARERLPIAIVVTNDAAFGTEVQFLRTERLPEDGATYPDIAFADVARALGIEAITLSDRADLERLPAFVANTAGPILIDCKVTSAVRGDWIDMRMRRDVKPA